VNQAGGAAFREVQRLRQWWVWLLVYGAATLTWYGFVQQIVLGQPFGTNPAPDWVMWLIWLTFGFGFPVFFHTLRLVVEVGHDRIRIRYVPLLTRTISFEEIESHAVRTYKPIRECGGWGIRWWGRQRRAYSVSGDQGVELKLHSGERVMVGSQKPEQLAQALAVGRQRR
jgi:hypothetical protein